MQYAIFIFAMLGICLRSERWETSLTWYRYWDNKQDFILGCITEYCSIDLESLPMPDLKSSPKSTAKSSCFPFPFFVHHTSIFCPVVFFLFFFLLFSLLFSSFSSFSLFFFLFLPLSSLLSSPHPPRAGVGDEGLSFFLLSLLFSSFSSFFPICLPFPLSVFPSFLFITLFFLLYSKPIYLSYIQNLYIYLVLSICLFTNQTLPTFVAVSVSIC